MIKTRLTYDETVDLLNNLLYTTDYIEDFHLQLALTIIDEFEFNNDLVTTSTLLKYLQSIIQIEEFVKSYDFNGYQIVLLHLDSGRYLMNTIIMDGNIEESMYAEHWVEPTL